ncbi:hypothetical protein GLOTRDRAFT_130824 [Gloeophyllum trabeum ATCC 11539]|uniref:Uncharacterized protein n=1 Tax=Gloeophyllum trabeum (strain ATCC 11539 / FP-39264 / Madison 617) TaxID=670483 RepID=S7Q0Q1_GLOTA|nr:uncharacterized protein GLOTRDRAFT_130824 [Gloeophyllum trabeum ATCC 11539]EPQ53486.1 hypothetical protein GLOTRDRAFT_130824 [Gloeophyllum trabeum ATCC 11539]
MRMKELPLAARIFIFSGEILLIGSISPTMPTSPSSISQPSILAAFPMAPFQEHLVIRKPGTRL